MAASESGPKNGEDARTLAAWCGRSTLPYNLGVYQTLLLLGHRALRDEVAAILDGLDDLDGPTRKLWGLSTRPESSIPD